MDLNGESLSFVDRSAYLGSDFHTSSTSAPDVNKRLGIAGGVMRSLDRSVWRNRHLSLETKLRVYNSLVLPILRGLFRKFCDMTRISYLQMS